jgi:hypothetical protein
MEYENTLNREFHTEKQNEKWVTDITINASLRMYKSDWIRMYNFDFNMHTDFEVKWCACKFENHNGD